jgi:hypothetical protein
MWPKEATEQLFLKFFSPDPPHEEGSERIYSLPWQPVLDTSHIRVVKRALVNNDGFEKSPSAALCFTFVFAAYP